MLWYAADDMLQAALSRMQGGVLTASAAVVNKCSVLNQQLVFLSADASEYALRAAHWYCRYLMGTPDEVRKLNALVEPFLQESYLEDIAIRVWPMGGGAFTSENIPEFARLIRRSDYLAVRALFLPFDQSGDLFR